MYSKYHRKSHIDLIHKVNCIIDQETDQTETT